MSRSLGDDVDYPYSPKPAALLVQPRSSNVAVAKPRPAWRFVGRWFLRLALAGAVMAAIAAIPVGITGYRARSQAAVVEKLESLGCRVDYLDEFAYSGVDGRVRNLLRDKYGDKYFGDVCLVDARELDPSVDASEVCRLCRRFDRIEYFDIGSESFRFDQIAGWKQLDQLNSLRIRSTSLIDADLARVGQMPALDSFELNSPKVTGAGLRHLGGAAKLTSLTIESALLDGSAPASEAGFPQLTSLTIRHAPRVLDYGIVNLGPMPELTVVTLENAPIGDEAIAHLAKGGKLAFVSLNGTKVTDRSLESLSNCPDLQWLELSGAKVTDAGIAMLAKCQGLTLLDVSGTRVTGKGLAGLSAKELSLTMDNTDVTDDGLREIMQIQGLVAVSLQNAKITGTGLGNLPAESSLPALDLTGASLTREGFAALAKSRFPSVSLARTQFDDKALMLFVENDVIGLLEVSETKVTARGLKAFYEARKQRLAAANLEESLFVSSDHAGIVEQFHSSMGSYGIADDPSLLLPDGAEPQPPPSPQEVNPN